MRCAVKIVGVLKAAFFAELTAELTKSNVKIVKIKDMT
jgi:hypothetical protein